MGGTAMLGVVVACGRNMKRGDKVTADFTGVTDSGKNIGDFKITIERMGSH